MNVLARRSGQNKVGDVRFFVFLKAEAAKNTTRSEKNKLIL